MKELTPFREITDEQWKCVSPLFLQESRKLNGGRGRPLSDTRSVLNGVLWVMYSGAAWSWMPSIYPPHTTCHRRFKAWCESGIFERVTDALAARGAMSMRDIVRSRTRGDWLHAVRE